MPLAAGFLLSFAVFFCCHIAVNFFFFAVVLFLLFLFFFIVIIYLIPVNKQFFLSRFKLNIKCGKK